MAYRRDCSCDINAQLTPEAVLSRVLLMSDLNSP